MREQHSVRLGGVLAAFVLLACCWLPIACNRDVPAPPESYFGQTPPGRLPVLFAPGIISTALREHSSPQFTPDGNEVIFAVADFDQHAILHARRVADMWTGPWVIPFSGLYSDDSPVLSPDGLRLYFRSRRPLQPEGPPQPRFHSWMVEKELGRWGTPRRYPDFDEYAIASIATDGAIYCHSQLAPDSDGFDLFRAAPQGDGYATPVNLGAVVNTRYDELWPCIASEESFLVFTARGRPSGDGLYVSFRQTDGGWSSAQPLGALIEGVPQDNFAGLSPDGKYLFFTSWRLRTRNYSERPLTYAEISERLLGPMNMRDDILWVDAAVIEELRPGGRQP